MDEVEERLRLFAAALADLQEALAAAAGDLRRCHDRVDPLWADEARRQYDRRFGPLLALLEQYVRVRGPGYLDVLADRHRAVLAYLHGDR